MIRRALALAALATAAPLSAQSNSTPIAAPAAASALVIRGGPGYLSGVNVVTGGTAGYVLLLDSPTVPASGSAVTPLRCITVAANTSIEVNYRSAALRFVNGITAVFSTTGCYTYTASQTAFIAGDIR